MSERLQHVVISASAGSGKTYQLVRRYVLLLAWGVEPEKIAAMTFTKKASGEFFNRILNRLADLAERAVEPDEFFAGMTPLPQQWPDFKKLLRRTVEAMQRLRLGTLDSFFANITSCFPLELGLPFGASVMSEDDASLARNEVLAALIEKFFLKSDDKGLGTMLEGFKQATYGAEEKRAVEAFMGWVEGGHDLWLERPDRRIWGVPGSIWPWGEGACLADLNLTHALERVRRAVNVEMKFTAKAAEDWEAMLSEIEGMTPGQELPGGAEKLLKKCGEVWDDLKAGHAVITLRKKFEFAGEEAAALLALCRCMVGRELLVRCERAQGVARMLEEYEATYGERVRQSGRLTFSDVTRLVGSSAAGWLQQGEGVDLWYRLDGRYEHWLFDEFQDTSFQQWNVVGGLVDEVLQSERQERSFFAVGDPKQSIYLWRQAEPRLFRRVAGWTDAEGRRLMKQEELLVSYRSAPAVLEAVNRVCVSDEALKQLLPGACGMWECSPHEAKRPMQGCARLLWPAGSEGQEETSPEDVAVELLRALRPLERGLSCAVLVRQNKKGREMAERIRRETHMEVVCESEQEPAIDNPVTLAVLALLKLAAHPGDGRALEHLRMTPLWPVIENDERSRFTTGRDILREVMVDGFASVVHKWIAKARMVAGDAWDSFAELRGKQLGDMAAEFDESGSRDVDRFLAFAEGRRLRVRGGHQAVQVMTVHASKGLEFDIVILPELSGNALKQLRQRDLLARRDDGGRLQWVLMEPKRDIARLDEVLGTELVEAEARQEFEGLCRLYVAMTRAKRSLYLITNPPPKTADSTMNEARLLRERLGSGSLEEEIGPLRVNVAWSTGDPFWHEQHVPVKPVLPPTKVGRPLVELLRERQPMVPRVTPSGEEDFRVKGNVLFSAGRDKGRVLGNLVHEMLSKLEWSISMDWSAFAAHDGYDEALRLILSALESSEVQAVFQKPAGPCKLWRERPFDVLLPAQGWISGTFDRVVVEPEAGRATIIDFKTDDLGENDGRMADKVQGYRPQLVLYQEAVKLLTGVKEVQCSLVFLRSGRVVTVS